MLWLSYRDVTKTLTPGKSTHPVKTQNSTILVKFKACIKVGLAKYNKALYEAANRHQNSIDSWKSYKKISETYSPDLSLKQKLRKL